MVIAFVTGMTCNWNPGGFIGECSISAFIMGERCSLRWPNSTQGTGEVSGRILAQSPEIALSVLVPPLLGLWPGVSHVTILSLYFFIHKLVWINLEPYVTSGQPAWQHWLIALFSLTCTVFFFFKSMYFWFASAPAIPYYFRSSLPHYFLSLSWAL